jgi:UDP-glucose 4-epimerase
MGLPDVCHSRQGKKVEFISMTKPIVLITGGAGYIGSHVNKLLFRKGYKTVVFDNLSTGHSEFVKSGEFFKGDLNNKSDIEKCISKYSVKTVMHFAASTAVPESVENPSKYYVNNVVNTVNLLDVVKKSGIRNFIFSSSAAVYGIPGTNPISETHLLSPINPYGNTKKIAEELISDYSTAYGLKYVSFRYFNAAGADPDGELGQWYDSFSHLIPVVLGAALDSKKAIKIFGMDYDTPDGTCIRDYIHVCDLASAHIIALEYLIGGGKSDCFNLGNGKGYSVLDVVKTAERVTGSKIRIIKTVRRGGDSPVSVAGSEKAWRILKWAPEYPSLLDIITTAWNWHRKIAGLGEKHGEYNI